MKKENENPSVGLLLCAAKNDEVVEYAMSRTMSPMLVSQYQLQLPDKAVLEKKLQQLVNIPQIEDYQKLDIENPIIRINTAFKGCSSLEKISVLPRIYHN